MNKLLLSIVMSGLCVSALADVNPVIDSKTCESPKYPKASLMNEETGSVTLDFLVNPDGKVIEAKVDKSSGFKNLDKAAQSALSLCKFKPGTKDGVATQAHTKVDFVWKLD